MDVPTVRWLASPAGQAALAALPPYAADEVFTLSNRLRAQGHPPEFVAALLTQQRLRSLARGKFGDLASSVLLTADGLEQASRLEVAAAHAARYAGSGVSVVHDLGCGIGADAMALSRAGIEVQAVDADPVTAALAAANLAPWPRSSVRVGRAEDFTAPEARRRDSVGVFLDPARRIPGVADAAGRTRRVFSVHQMSPSWDVVQSLASTVPATGAKLSPAFPHGSLPAGVEAQWTSWERVVVECALWWGPMAQRAGRTARLLSPSRAPVEVDEAMAQSPVPLAYGLPAVGRWLHEPDRAVMQAGLVGAVTAATNGCEVDSGLGYVLTDSDVTVPYARRYAVSEAMPLSEKVLRGWLRARGVTGVTIKKRGVVIDDERLRRALRLGRGAGSGAQVTIALTRISGSPVVIVLTPDS